MFFEKSKALFNKNKYILPIFFFLIGFLFAQITHPLLKTKESPEYQNLLNLIIEMHGTTQTGITLKEVQTNARLFAIYASTYKAKNNMNKKERESLNNILTAMGNLQKFWAFSNYNCSSFSKIKEPCLDSYARVSYDTATIIFNPFYEKDDDRILLNSANSFFEEYKKAFAENIKLETSSFYDLHNEEVSRKISILHEAINAYLKTQDINL